MNKRHFLRRGLAVTAAAGVADPVVCGFHSPELQGLAARPGPLVVGAVVAGRRADHRLAEGLEAVGLRRFTAEDDRLLMLLRKTDRQAALAAACLPASLRRSATTTGRLKSRCVSISTCLARAGCTLADARAPSPCAEPWAWTAGSRQHAAARATIRRDGRRARVVSGIPRFRAGTFQARRGPPAENSASSPH